MLILSMGGVGEVGVVSSCLFAERAIHLDDSLQSLQSWSSGEVYCEQ